MMLKRLAHGKVVQDITTLSLPSHEHNLRQLPGRGFQLPAGSQKKFEYRAVKAYNALAPETRNLPPGPRFQQCVKDGLLS